MTERILAAIVLGTAVTMVVTIVVLIVRLLGDAFIPIVLLGVLIAVGSYVVDTIWSWLQTP